MPTNVCIYNDNASLNTDTFKIVDKHNGRAVIASLPVRGGDTISFDCASDTQGYGDLEITNITNNTLPLHFPFVRGGDVIYL